MSKKFSSNMKRVIQMTLKHSVDEHFDAQSKIAGMLGSPGLISVFAVAGKAGSLEVDQIICYFEDSHPNVQLVSGQRYAWINVGDANEN